MKKILLLCLVGMLSCKTEVKTVDSCGDGVIDPGEQCDGAELAGSTCDNLGYYNTTAALACHPDCTFDLTACGNRCGDGTVETVHGEDCDGASLNGASCVSLNYTNGGDLSCDSSCHFVTSDCQTTCGNGNVEPGEPCDDGNEAAGDGCSSDCTVEEGWLCEGESVSVCRPFCDQGLTFCSGECFDLANDPAHCGTCTHACDDGELCVGSTCRLPDAPWENAGSFSAFQFNLTAHRYAVSECAGGPFLYSIDTSMTPYTYSMYQLGVVSEQWSPLPALVMEGAEGVMPDEGMSVTCTGSVRVAAYSGGGGDQELAVRWYDANASTWKMYGSSPLMTQCGGTNYLGMSVDSSESVHVLSEGSGGCGMAVDYAWWDGSQWQAHPSMTTFPRQLTQNSSGHPSIVTHGSKIYIGIVQRVELPTWHVAHQVWTWQNDEWTQVGADLEDETDLNNNSEEMSLAVDPAGRLCAAYIKNIDGAFPVPTQKLHVKCFDVGMDSWVRLGETEVNPDHNATVPRLIFVGMRPYLAYQRRVNENNVDLWKVRVLRWDPALEEWELIGSGMESASDYESFSHQLVTHGDRVFLSYLQGDSDSLGPAYLYIKKP